MADVSKIKLGSTTYNIKDSNAALKTEAIKNITRSGTTFTVTRTDDTTFTFTQQDNNTTYSANTGIKLNGTTFQHTNAVTAGTAGTSSATSGSTLAVPYVTYDAQGHVTGSGTHTHTISGFLTSSSSLDASKVSGTVGSAAKLTWNTLS